MIKAAADKTVSYESHMFQSCRTHQFTHSCPLLKLCYGMFTLPYTDTDTDTDKMGLKPNCICVGVCVCVGQYEHFHTILYSPFLLVSVSVSVSVSVLRVPSNCVKLILSHNRVFL